MVTLLISAKCKIDNVDKDHNTALHISTKEKNAAIVKVLLEAGFTNKPNKNQQTPLDIAVAQNWEEGIKLFKEAFHL